MLNLYKAILITFAILCSGTLLAQDLRINKIDNLPDSSLFTSSYSCRVHFRCNSSVLSAPYTIYFNYSVNGIVQAIPLDSLAYAIADTNERFVDINFMTNSPIFRKGDNIVVVWPICYQATNTANYVQKRMFVTDTLHTGIETMPRKLNSKWDVIFNNETKKLSITDLASSEFPIQLRIYTSSGSLLYSERMNHGESARLNQLDAGIYIFELSGKNGQHSGRFLSY